MTGGAGEVLPQPGWFTIPTSVVYNQRLAEHVNTASTDTVGDSFGIVLASIVNGSEVTLV